MAKFLRIMMEFLRKHKKHKKDIIKRNTGFTLIFALLVSSIVLLVAMGVYIVIYKEIQLSGVSRDSQIAFYAADAAVECVFYWDLKQDKFSTTDPNVIYCNDPDESSPITVGGAVTSAFELRFENGSCAQITVTKDPTGGTTEIEARGYNLACDDSTGRKVQRTLYVTY